MSIKDDMPRSDVNKEYYTQNMEREVTILHLRNPMPEKKKYVNMYVLYVNSWFAVCVRSRTQTVPDRWGCWVKHRTPATCCWSWREPRRTTNATDLISAPSGWRESVREERSVPTGPTLQFDCFKGVKSFTYNVSHFFL